MHANNDSFSMIFFIIDANFLGWLKTTKKKKKSNLIMLIIFQREV